MQLVNMDVDRYGTNERCQLGPFSPGLNALCGPRGSGKSTLLSWLRQITIEDHGIDYVAPTYSRIDVPVTGWVEIRDGQQSYRASTDRAGRLKIEPTAAPRNGWATENQFVDYRPAPASRDWISQSQREIFSGLATATGAADTESSLQQLAQRLGMDDMQPNSTQPQREQLHARQRDLRLRLERLQPITESHTELDARRRELEAELSRLNETASVVNGQSLETDRVRLTDREQAIRVDLDKALSEASSLEQKIASLQGELKVAESNNCVQQVGPTYRKQLRELDDRLNRWRQTLRDLRTHRESIEHDAVDARLEKQIGDQLAVVKAADPRGALRSLETQILNTRKQLDEIIGRYGELNHEKSSGYNIVHDASGETRIAYTDSHRNIPESATLTKMLKAMQRDLYEVCQQLARHESQSTTANLRSQAQQFERCESELLQSVEKLIEERADLLRTIAAEHHLSIDQLTLAFGQWCQCHDHPHLQEWLLEQETQPAIIDGQLDPARRVQILDEIESLKSQRKQAQLKAEQCRHQLRDADALRRELPLRSETGNRPTKEAEIRAALQRVLSLMHDVEVRDRLRAELAEVERQLSSSQGIVSKSPFRAEVDQHIAAIMGTFTRSQADRSYRNIVDRRYDTFDGDVTEAGVEFETHEKVVPSAVVRIAMRLAIASAASGRGAPVSLMLDQTLDQLPQSLQRRAAAHLASIAGRGQQIVVLTSDEHVASLVRDHRGWVGYLRSTPTPTLASDVNRQLAAVANEHEADRWIKDRTTRPAAPAKRSRYYLSESSLVEDSPSIDPTAAARLRALGVDRINDLLDADSDWLADNLRLDGVSGRTVARWQAEATLLCTVRDLLPFDARVLVGAGIISSSQLASFSPGELFERVDDFLQTPRGQRILSSGSSFELSRIRTWISEAKHGGSHRRDGRHSETRPYAEARSSSRTRSSSRRSKRTYPVVGRDTGERRRQKSRSSRVETVRLSSEQESESATVLKFYLELSSPVVDAPSIGPRMATRLEKHGIYSVDQLLAADAENLADKLDLRRVDADTIVAWQQQATLVCRIPNLRGHDAQMLVACGFTSPENLATLDANAVLSDVSAFADTSEGQRVLRGGKHPDLDEVQDWLAWAAQCRSLSAA